MWKIKLLIQFVLGNLPYGEKVNYLLQKLSNNHSPEQTASRLDILAEELTKLNRIVPLRGITVMEIGTGWFPINPFMLYLFGVSRCHTYDHERHIRLELVQLLVREIEKKIPEIARVSGIPESDLRERHAVWRNCRSIEEYLAAAGVEYYAPADATRTGLPDHSVDLLYSYAVLAHLPKPVLLALIREGKRILKSNGHMYHYIGMHDQFLSFDRSLSRVNFLKYPEWLWSFFTNNKINYNNRFRERQFLDIFESCGGQIVWRENKLDPADVEIARQMKVSKEFAGLTPEELAVYLSKIVVRFTDLETDPVKRQMAESTSAANG